MPAEPPAARCLHRLPGRIRLRIDAKRGDEAWFDDVAVNLATARGITRVRGSARTGSLLIEHELDNDELERRAEAEGWFRLDDAAAAGWQPQAELRRAMAMPSAAEWVALVLFAAACVQAARRDILPPAVSLLVYAASALFAAERRHAMMDAAAEASSQGRPAAAPPT